MTTMLDDKKNQFFNGRKNLHRERDRLPGPEWFSGVPVPPPSLIVHVTCLGGKFQNCQCQVGTHAQP